MRRMTCTMLALLAATTLARAQAPVARDGSADSALVRYAGQLIIERLAPSMSSAAHDTTQSWWTMRFPPSHVPAMWDDLRAYLSKALRARDSVASDSTRAFIDVGHVQNGDNVMTFRVTIGVAQRCNGAWRGNDHTYFVRTERSGGTWMWPTVQNGPHSYSASCW